MNLKSSLQLHSSQIFIPLLLATRAASVLESPDKQSDQAVDGAELIFGINLGASYLQVALTSKGTTELIPDTQGRTKTPFIVSYHESGPVVGWDAQEDGNKEQGNVISNFANLLGKNAKQGAKDVIPGQELLEIVESKESASVRIVQGQQNRLVSFEEVLSKLFVKLKEDVYAQTGKKMLNAMVAVPNGFGDDQKRAIKAAGELAGINIVRSVKQYLAAGLAHSLEKDTYADNEKVFLSINFDDHAIEISIATVGRQVYDMLSNYQYDDYNLPHWDAMSEEFDCEYGEGRGNDRGQLSCSYQHQISSCSTNIERFNHRHSYGLTQTCPKKPSRLIEHFWKLYSKMRHEAEKNVGDMNLGDLSVIVLTGDLGRAMRARSLLRTLFPSTQIMDGVASDECFVQGVAISGDHLSQWDDSEVQYIEINVLGLGIEVAGGAFQKVIPKHYMLAHTNRLNVTTVVDNQTRIEIPIYEGERYLARRNKLLGTIVMDPLPLAPRGSLIFRICFRIDLDKTLDVRLVEFTSGREVILRNLPTWSVDDGTNLDDLVEEAELTLEQDKEEVRKLEASQNPPLSVVGVQVAMKCNFDHNLGKCSDGRY